MNEEYIVLWTESFRSILESFMSNDVAMQKKIFRDFEENGADMSIIIGVVGDLKGQVYFTMNENVAITLSSILAGGVSINEIDEIVKSAMGEFANMVMGNACTAFCEKGINLDITPPTIVTGNNYDIKNFTPVFYNDVIIDGVGEMYLDISLNNIQQ